MIASGHHSPQTEQNFDTNPLVCCRNCCRCCCGCCRLIRSPARTSVKKLLFREVCTVVEGYHGITVQLTYMYGALGVYFFLSFETRFLVIFRGLFFIFVFVVSTGTSPTSSTTPSATFTRPHTFWMLRTYRYIACCTHNFS
jgi:hypothetical protein